MELLFSVKSESKFRSISIKTLPHSPPPYNVLLHLLPSHFLCLLIIIFFKKALLVNTIMVKCAIINLISMSGKFAGDGKCPYRGLCSVVSTLNYAVIIILKCSILQVTFSMVEEHPIFCQS